ncbi:periplasmic binding protein-like I [Rhizoclosmatium globosum]|uniref:Periplasmic binding protein-like I n=1 Tax=Rhizoclosmatium globosum TaxID=329046 RepID=A0A1Y2CCF2_9FUNG|nr:periplasmic binding protein-like I [Rhizoclosmatium globosum]|eukprot:ORY44514.1 periplasmic binding protein-like I [Rhizoclosmatium globosum]
MRLSHECLSSLLICLLTLSASSQNFIDPIIGFYPGTSSIESKRQNNITIAFLLPFKIFWNLTDQAEYDKCLFCSWMRQMDSAAELVVNQVNNDSNILPNTMVNILRVQSWDQQTLNGATSQGDGIGGTAVSVMQLVENNHNVVAVYGDTSDLSTKLSAQMLSQFKIPMCGGVQNLPQLSDKNNFPYFFRSSGSGKWGRDFSVILTKWKIKRVSIVYDADDIDSAGACLDVKTYLFQNNIIVLSNRGYRGNNPHVNFQDIALNLSG